MLTTKLKLEILCDLNGTTLAAVAREIGISKSAMSRYDESVPSGETLLKLAQYFHVTPESLLNSAKKIVLIPESDDHDDIQSIVDLLGILKFSKNGYAVATDMLISLKKNVDRASTAEDSMLEARNEARQEERNRIIRNLLRSGLSKELIALSVGLSVDEIVDEPADK